MPKFIALKQFYPLIGRTDIVRLLSADGKAQRYKGMTKDIPDEFDDCKVVNFQTFRTKDGEHAITLYITQDGPASKTDDANEGFIRRGIGSALKRWHKFKNEDIDEPEQRSDFYDPTEDFDSASFEEIDSKRVLDSDGFETDYTWYRREDGLNVFVFGDKELYRPEEGAFDWEEESDEAASDWFKSYRGFDNTVEFERDDDFVDRDLDEDTETDDEIDAAIKAEDKAEDRRYFRVTCERNATAARGWATRAIAQARRGNPGKATQLAAIARDFVITAQRYCTDLQNLVGDEATEIERAAIEKTKVADQKVRRAETIARNKLNRSD